MPYSGTVSQTVFDTRRVIENAARRCRVPPQSLTAEHIDVAKDQLFLLLSDLSNRGMQLWCIQKSIYPLYEGQAQIVTDLGTVDVLNGNLRSLKDLTGAVTTSATAYTTSFAGPVAVSTVGVQGDNSGVPLVFERSADEVVWTQVGSITPQTEAGEWFWFDIDSVKPGRFFRVRATSGTPDFSRVIFGNNPTEIPLARLNRDDYTNLPNKTFQSNRPLQYWLDRQTRSPVLNLWPVPNAGAETSQIVLWVQRHIMDVGAMTQEIEVPQRWYEAIVAQLAARLALEYMEVDPQLIPILDSKAAQSLAIAMIEERDNSPVNLLPDISMYTR